MKGGFEAVRESSSSSAPAPSIKPVEVGQSVFFHERPMLPGGRDSWAAVVPPHRLGGRVQPYLSRSQVAGRPVGSIDHAENKRSDDDHRQHREQDTLCVEAATPVRGGVVSRLSGHVLTPVRGGGSIHGGDDSVPNCPRTNVCSRFDPAGTDRRHLTMPRGPMSIRADRALLRTLGVNTPSRRLNGEAGGESMAEVVAKST